MSMCSVIHACTYPCYIGVLCYLHIQKKPNIQLAVLAVTPSQECWYGKGRDESSHWGPHINDTTDRISLITLNIILIPNTDY